MSPVADLPAQLVLALLTALDAGGHSAAAGNVAALASSPVAQSDPYRFAAQPFFDAIEGLRSDKRFGRFAHRVFKTSSGEAYVPVIRDAEAILALRRDPVIARHVTEHYARANAIALKRALGREVTLADLYLAHRVGLRFATEILHHGRIDPHALAALVLPELDDVAPTLVFAGDRALSFAQIIGTTERAVSRATAGLARNVEVTPAIPPLPERNARVSRRMGLRKSFAHIDRYDFAPSAPGAWRTAVVDAASRSDGRAP